jgi:hypothetical protein
MKPSICFVFAAICSLLASPAFAAMVAKTGNRQLPPASVSEVVQVDHGSTALSPVPESRSSALVSLFGIGWLFFRRRI